VTAFRQGRAAEKYHTGWEEQPMEKKKIIVLDAGVTPQQVAASDCCKIGPRRINGDEE
jgi:hypothetical protein